MRPIDKVATSETRTTLAFVSKLWSIHHALERASERMEARIGVTAPQRLVIRTLGRYPGTTPGQLAEMLGVHPATVSTQLRRLERRQLLTRLRDPRDRRRVMLGLTPAGRAFDRPMEGTVEQAAAKALSSLAPADVAVTERVLDGLRAALAGVGGDPSKCSPSQAIGDVRRPANPTATRDLDPEDRAS